MLPPLFLTAGQQAVLASLRRQAQPLSAQAFHRVMCAQRPIGLATVYRALDVLKLLGLAQHRVTLTGETLYSAVEHDHYYLTCLQCGVSVPVETCPVQELAAQLQGASSFRIYYHTLEFFGVCGCVRGVGYLKPPLPKPLPCQRLPPDQQVSSTAPRCEVLALG